MDERPTSRVTSVDLLRGAVMIVMALDHVRDFFMNVPYEPENLAKSNIALFLTRWITHFCAPTFFLLAGTAIGLTVIRGRSVADASRFLLTRGLWLVFLEFTVVAIGWRFHFALIPIIPLVIWALGMSMILLALLIRLPRWAIAAFALVMIAGHNLFDGIKPGSLGAFGPLWAVLHVQGPIGEHIFIAYPLIPWIGVMALGYALAAVYRWEAPRRQRFLLIAGVAATLAFVALRLINSYGDDGPWKAQSTGAMTVASFLNTEKYPPSLLYLLMTLGPMLIVLSLIENARGTIARWITVYGRVPFFYYILHIYLIHAMAVMLAGLRGGNARAMLNESTPWPGVSLGGVYLVWALTIVLLYLPCRWFAGLKARRKDWWLSYL